MLAVLPCTSRLLRPAVRAMSTVRSHSPPTPPSAADEPASKRQRLDENGARKAVRRRTLPYGQGMHLAPMVRIGTLPMRLAALEYGAELVWGPEIVDKGIIGCERVVNSSTGVVSFMKGGRSIFETHPIEKPRLIFQLGSASPELAVQALKVIEQDVAGVGLNCGCPKTFSLQGGMGAALLKDPERLCSILRALVGATDLPIDAKIRLLPLPKEPKEASPDSAPTPSCATSGASASPGSSAPPASAPNSVADSSAPASPASSARDSETPLEPPTLLIPPTATPSSAEPTLPLVAQILSTGISNLTVHCRTQEMRSSEPALHERMREITTMGQDKGIPVVCNGDVLGGGKDAHWGNFQEVCKKTGVSSVMIARAAESNASCFSTKGLADPLKEVAPRLLKLGIATGNHYNNTKYILNALDLYASPTPPSREVNREYKQKMNKAKSYELMGAVFGMSEAEVKEVRETRVEDLLPSWSERRRLIVEE
ncbi:hypothetical protein JCM11251_001718 [Rhodosporidiobolus azoricus]